MGNLADHIEKYLKYLIQQSATAAVTISRSELAEKFECVPSQINYVLSTRFTKDKGYLVSSRRGGGGYIEIAKLRLSKQGTLGDVIDKFIGHQISEKAALGLIQQLYEEGMLTDREKQLLLVVSKREVLSVPLPTRDQIRANVLSTALTEVFKY